MIKLYAYKVLCYFKFLYINYDGPNSGTSIVHRDQTMCDFVVNSKYSMRGYCLIEKYWLDVKQLSASDKALFDLELYRNKKIKILK